MDPAILRRVNRHMMNGNQQPEYDKRFCELMRAVASGKMTVDTAWQAWLKIQKEDKAKGGA